MAFTDPMIYTFDNFVEDATKVMKEFDIVETYQFTTEDCVPWINIEGGKVIKPKEALAIMEKLQATMVDQVLFNSLSGRELRIVVNGKFVFTPEKWNEIGLDDFDEEYALDYGSTIEEMKEEYNLS